MAYIQFLGAAGTVTGSKHLINTGYPSGKSGFQVAQYLEKCDEAEAEGNTFTAESAKKGRRERREGQVELRPRPNTFDTGLVSSR